MDRWMHLRFHSLQTKTLFISQFTMTDFKPSISSKLYTVATLMNDFTVLENRAWHLQHNEDILRAQNLNSICADQANTIRRMQSRIIDLEADLRATLDRNEQLVEAVYQLEISILECRHHARPPVSPVDTAHEPMEVIDLVSTDEELTDDEEVYLNDDLMRQLMG